MVTCNELYEEIASMIRRRPRMRHFSKHDVRATVRVIAEVMGEELARGEKCQFPRIGSFSTTSHTSRKGTRVRIRWRPSSILQKRVRTGWLQQKAKRDR